MLYTTKLGYGALLLQDYHSANLFHPIYFVKSNSAQENYITNSKY